MTDFLQPEFWDWHPRENWREWSQRVRSCPGDPSVVLGGFLDDPRPEVRCVGIQALINLRRRPSEPLRRRVMELLATDPAGTVRDRAMAFCESYELKEALPLIVAIQQDPELLKHLTDDPGLARDGRWSELETRIVHTLRRLGYSPAPSDELRAAAGRPLSPFPEPNYGAYVGRQYARTELLPRERGPACPNCRRGLGVLIRLERDAGPPDAPRDGLPFYRCLHCVMHEPLFVRVEGRVGCLNRPSADRDEDRSPEPGSPPSGILWHAPDALSDGSFFRPALGGEPLWLQQPAHPDCLGCGGRMTFVVQLGFDAWHFPVAEYGGVDYGFWCGACRVTATLFQAT